MKQSTKFFISWMVAATLCIFLQITMPYNLGILFATLLAPIFIHDILIMFFKELKGGGK